VPILPSRDLMGTLRFYEALGFENRGAPPQEWSYLIIGRGDLEVHFVEEPSTDPFRTAGSCYLFVDDADALFRGWGSIVEEDPSTGSRVIDPVDTDYGMREFAVVDNTGNLIRIGSPV